MALSTNDFGKAVVAAGLLPADDLKSIWDSLPADARPKNADAFAKLLIKQGKLNEFQSQELLSGSGTPLVLGDYVLLAKIGAGGMGQVFKAQHRHMKRLAAIKLLPAAMTKDEGAVKRFQREVQAAAKLSHPNIVQTFDAGVQRGVWYLVMEYVEGRDLSATVKQRGPLPVEEAVNYITQAARGLAFAHSEGVVHRDIKPANLLLDKKWTVKILDMGLARFDDGVGAVAAAAVEGLTQSGQVMGTVDYMAPEQAFDTRQADARADVYSLGCSLYRLLTGENVYSGDTVMQKFLAHREKPIPSLRVKRPEVSEALDAIFQKMMAKLPEDRHQSTSQLVAELEACAAPTVSNANQGASQATSTFVPNSGSGKSHPTDAEDGMTAALGNQLLRSLPDSCAAPRDDTFSSSANDRTHRGHRGQKTAIIGSKGRPWKDPLVLAAAGAAALLILTLGVWGIVRNKDVKPIANVEVPERGSVDEKMGQGNKNKDATKIDPVAPAPPPAKAPFDADQAKAHQAAWANYLGTKVETTNSIGMKMVLIPPGEFLMGSSDEQINATAIALNLSKATLNRLRNDERPQHRVNISKTILMSTMEVTVGQFRKFVEATNYVTQSERFGSGSSSTTIRDTDPKMKNELTWRSPGYATADDMPVTQVTWNDVVTFCNWMSQQDKIEASYSPASENGWTLLPGVDGYRLPTEAEWEYACRAGTMTLYSFGDDFQQLNQYAWNKSNAAQGAMPVGSKPPNPFGLHDMHGNVWEWCQDWSGSSSYEVSPPIDPTGPASGTTRVLRSGGWADISATSFRSAMRGGVSPARRTDSAGFRVVRAIDGQPKKVSVGSSEPTSSGTTRPVDTPPPAKAPFNAEQAKAHQAAWAKYLGTKVETTNSVGMRMILIPPGEFLMGSTDEQVEAALKVADLVKADAGIKERIRDTERPQHRVVITKPFLMGTTEVTIGQYKKFAAATGYKTDAEQAGETAKKAPPGSASKPKPMQTYLNLGFAATDEAPATFISWNDAVAFCIWLSEQEKLGKPYEGAAGKWMVPLSEGYHLPTEAQWEYACRAGTTTQYFFGDAPTLLKDYAWSNGAGLQNTGLKPPNSFGLHDMHGNVEDWCQDLYDGRWYEKSPVSDPSGPSSGTTRAVRGGSWLNPVSHCRSASRHYLAPSFGSNYFGFRVVRVLDAPATTTNITPQPSISATPDKITTYDDPAFQQWMKDVAAMPAEEQIKAVSKKLMELNPGFDGQVTGADGKSMPKIEQGAVTDLNFIADSVTDISPVRALKGLKVLQCNSFRPKVGKLSDLSPLQGMTLTKLAFFSTQVSDLSPLAGMPLTYLDCGDTNVSDLSPIRGMPLKELKVSLTLVSNLSPALGLPLKVLHLHNSSVSDLSALRGMTINTLVFTPDKITNGLDIVREMTSLHTIGVNLLSSQQFSSDVFWKKYDTGEFRK